MSEARIAELESKVAALLAAVEALTPKLTDLEQLFPGAWEKRWSGKGDRWDSSGTEVFIARGDAIRLLRTTAGIRTNWSVQVEWDGKTIRLHQRHRHGRDAGGLASIVVELTGDPVNGYTGTERVGEHTIAVEYSRFVGPVDESRARTRRKRSPDEWRALVATRDAKRAKTREDRLAVEAEAEALLRRAEEEANASE